MGCFQIATINLSTRECVVNTAERTTKDKKTGVLAFITLASSMSTERNLSLRKHEMGNSKYRTIKQVVATKMGGIRLPPHW